MATTLNGKPALQVVYTLVDNGPLDLDPDVGEISDPVGLGIVATQAGLASTGQSAVAYIMLAGILMTASLGVVSLRKKKS